MGSGIRLAGHGIRPRDVRFGFGLAAGRQRPACGSGSVSAISGGLVWPCGVLAAAGRPQAEARGLFWFGFGVGSRGGGRGASTPNSPTRVEFRPRGPGGGLFWEIYFHPGLPVCARGFCAYTRGFQVINLFV